MPAWTAKPSLRPIFGRRHEVDDRLVELLHTSLRHFRFQERAVFPDAFEDEGLRSVTSRTLVMVGDKEIIYDPDDALGRARSLIPNVRTVLVADAGHMLNLEKPGQIDGELLTLLTSE